MNKNLLIKQCSAIKIVSFDDQLTKNFINKLKVIGVQKSYKNCLQYKGSLNKKKKNTILKSPHVFKKARDQIEIQHISDFFEIKTHFNWLFFLCNFKQYNNNPFKFDYKYCYKQKVYFF
jgi:ribosomal protein S10